METIQLFNMKLARVTMQEALATVLEWCLEPRGDACRYIVTPNVDHAVMLRHREDLQSAYEDASLALADGLPLVAASRLFRRSLPERVAGSDLVPQLFASGAKLRVFLLGAAPGVGAAAAARIARDWPAIDVAGTYSPPLGFENSPQENERIVSLIAATQPELLVLGFGAPKQELWIHQHRHELQAKVAICAGATIDFLAGHRRRSPVWMRKAGLEWLHRVAGEPRRLAGRYARDAWEFPQLLWGEWRRHYS
jgi:N-acetylglucosaminyldiphosphoundecaprenol N-acetyl-beta-D-mannosaminyltransferase